MRWTMTPSWRRPAGGLVLPGPEGANVPVDYTPVKNVKKPAGARPGMVIYSTCRTVNVAPEEGLVKKLQLS
ncbi:MAG: hypothetical protein ACLTYN_00775 [Dysosmobacter welbionis]